MSYYHDLREFLVVLERSGNLVRIQRPVFRETELMPLYRLQFRGLPENERRAFLFENVVGVDGQRFNGMMACGVYGASLEIYALGLDCRVDEIQERWVHALLHPIDPELVEEGPVHEEVHLGKELERSGLSEVLPPVEEPGFSGTIRTTTQILTKDPETGIRNLGAYSGHIHGKKRIACGIGRNAHGHLHWQKSRSRGSPLDAAIIVGSAPSLTFAAATAVPYGVDEYSIAGGIAGEPMKLVRCKTVDLEVPATAEIVIEGKVLTDVFAERGSFGEYPGYMYEGTGDYVPVMEVTCITHRKRPIFTPFFVGLAPTDSYIMSRVRRETVYYKFLKHDCNIPGILEVAFPEPMAGSGYCVIRIKKTHPSQPWQILNCLAGYASGAGKVIIVVDEDVNPRDYSAVMWALSYAMQPHRDLRVITGKSPGLDPSGYPPGASREERRFPQPHGSSAVLIDATRKWPYPPVGLPKKEYMERALKMWEEEKLPQLQLREPWYGYPLGNWGEENEENAALILRGEYEKVGERLAMKKKDQAR
jgi:4-hydroxy-3-polyprenylbenzoate decarboxylase